jgi:hypothetical protein
MRELDRTENREVVGSESQYRSTLRTTPVEGSVELFE